MTTHEDAIAYLLEKLREIAAIENALYANHARATKEIGNMGFQAYMDHREAAELHYAVADRCEQLIEAITAIPLFDQLDADEAEAAELAEARKQAAALSSTPLAVAFGAATADETFVDTLDDGTEVTFREEAPGSYVAEIQGAWDDPAVRRAVREHIDYTEADDVRQIEREMAIEAGDDSELDRQIAKDDARAERAATGNDELCERNDEWTAKGELWAELRSAVDESAPHSCDNCLGIDPDTCLFNGEKES